MRIAICDDEQRICDLIKNTIERYYSARELDFDIRVFYSGEEVLHQDLAAIDVLFLDVDMPGKNGMEVARLIREKNKEMLIVFMTAYSEFVFESFKVDAFRYLLKPVECQAFQETLDAISHKFEEKQDVLTFQFQNEIFHIRYADIIYIEGMRDKIWIYCKEQTYRWRGTMKYLTDLLENKHFFQVHRSYIINMEKIKKYNSQSITLEGGYEVPISKYRLNEFKEAYIGFWSKIL